MKSLYIPVLGAALLGMVSAAEAGVLVPSKTLDIRFIGFCDGLRLVINEATGRVTGNRTGSCVAHTAIFGTVGSNANKGAGVTVTIEDGTAFVFIIDDSPQGWTIHNLVGTQINSGNYAVGVAAREGGGVARKTTQR